MNKKVTFLVALLLMVMFPASETHADVPSMQETRQEGVIKGTVLDNNGEPVIGATVVLKGDRSAGAVTDIDGHFTLKVADGTLVVSYVGYKTQEVKLKRGQTNLVIHLAEDTGLLDEVIVTGYLPQKKASLTSAISQVRGEEVFKDKGMNNPTTALQGEVPGLTITRTSTRPGSEDAKMKIRGDISINGDSSPLILIDGVAGSLDELNSMDGSDIANISVLKDASAAIYGARSASGVVLVTTKRGKQGKAQINYSASFSRTIDGIQSPITTNSEWLDMFYQAQYNDAAAANPSLTDPNDIHNSINWWIFNSFGGISQDDGKTYKGEPLFQALRDGQSLTLKNGNLIERWEPQNYLMDYLYGQASSQKHSVSISGADEKFAYRVSLNYADNNSQLKVAKDNEKKYGGRLNADYQATEQLKLETNMSYEMRNITNPSQGVGQGWMDPWFWAVYDQAGNAYDTFSKERNPIAFLTQGGQNKTNWSTFRSSLRATYDLSKWVKGLSLSANGAYKVVEKEYTEEKNQVYFYDWVGTQSGTKSGPGSLKEERQKWSNTTLSAFINYKNTFAKVHNVEAMLGIQGEEEDHKKVKAGRNSGPIYPGSGLVDLDVWVSAENNEASGGQDSWGFMSYLTTLRYNYNQKYLFEFLGRRDGSSKLSLNQRWKNFYSVSGAWVISSEEFMKNLTWLDFLKVRYNYGKTGSVTGINNYERYSTMSTGSYLFGNANQTTLWMGYWDKGVAYNSMTSDQRTWETIHSHNAGLDFGVLNNRLTGSFDYFVKTNDGMFIDVTYPSILGAVAPKTNNGKLRAKGWEVALNWRDKIGDLEYNIGGSLSDAWSEVLELTNNENVPNPGKNTSRLVGKPLEAIYVYQTDGVFQNQEQVDAFYEMYYWNAGHTGPKAGNILPAPAETGTNRLRPGARKLVDIDGDGAITTKDVYYAGDAAPRLTFGLKGGLNWKGIDLSVFFQGVGKQTLLRSGNLYAPFVVNYVLQNNTYLGKTWSPENATNDFAILSRDNNFNKFNYENKDVSVQKNRYIRLKSLVVGYTLPKQWTAKAGINKVRVYFSGDDLWEWTKVKDGYDPEYGENSNNTFPFSRLLSFGFDITF